MVNCLKISLSFLLIILSFSLLPSATTADSGHLVVNEIYYDTAGDKGVEKTNEWVELYNPTSEAINLKNWTITDSSTTTPRVINLDYIIGSKSFAVITKDTSTWAYWSLPDKALKIELGLIIGNGLNNDGGDKVILKNSSGDPVDEINYGGGGSYDLSDVAEGHSLERSPVGGGEFVDQPTPTPGIGLPSKTILTLGVITEQSIELNWIIVPDEDFKEYLICISDKNCAAPVKSFIDQTITTATIEGLNLGTQYKIKVRVVNSSEGFWDSNEEIVLTKMTYSSAIIVNELFPHPSTGINDEFIELYNSSD